MVLTLTALLTMLLTLTALLKILLTLTASIHHHVVGGTPITRPALYAWVTEALPGLHVTDVIPRTLWVTLTCLACVSVRTRRAIVAEGTPGGGIGT